MSGVDRLAPSDRGEGASPLALPRDIWETETETGGRAQVTGRVSNVDRAAAKGGAA